MHDQRPQAADPPAAPPQRRLPPWLKRPAPHAAALLQTRRLINGLQLNTVCVEARCPNLTECWSRHTATFMILGDTCTRHCGFCAVSTGRPDPPDETEPQRLAEAAAHLKLKHVVITSVSRDDLPDEGAGHFARCIGAVRQQLQHSTIEVLVPDFHARPECVQAVTGAGPDVFNHNLEVVESQQQRIRPQADYRRSLETLRLAKQQQPATRTKSGIMVGVGETRDELLQAFKDLRAAGCDLLTIGQYLKPQAGDAHISVARYYPPDEFRALGDLAKELGFQAVASGPFVRSSYFAETLYREA
jgi:lipoic acid synthetase